MSRRMWRRDADGRIVRAAPPEAGAEGDASGTSAPAPGAGRRRAHLGLALRLGFRDTYDYLGSVVLQSLLWAVLVGIGAVGAYTLGILLFHALPGYLPLVGIGLVVTAAVVLIGGPLAAGIFRFARNATARQEPEALDLTWGLRHALGRSLALAAVQITLALIFAGNCLFYASLRHPAAVVLGALFAYALVFWLLMCGYAWPLLAEQQIGTLAILRKSALLVLDNLFYSLLLGLLILAFTLLSWTTLVVGVLLWVGATAMLLTQATRELLRKYDLLPPDPTLDPAAGETHEFAGHGRHE